MNELIVADASPLIVLGRIGHLQSLASVAGAVIVPDAVVAECVRDPDKPGALEIEKAFRQGWLRRQPDHPTYAAVDVEGLGHGERAAIGLALILNATILIDERIGRQYARSHALRVVGTLGILLRAKTLGHIDELTPTLTRLRSMNFFISSELEKEVLRLAGEERP